MFQHCMSGFQFVEDIPQHSGLVETELILERHEKGRTTQNESFDLSRGRSNLLKEQGFGAKYERDAKCLLPDTPLFRRLDAKNPRSSHVKASITT